MTKHLDPGYELAEKVTEAELAAQAAQAAQTAAQAANWATLANTKIQTFTEAHERLFDDPKFWRDQYWKMLPEVVKAHRRIAQLENGIKTLSESFLEWDDDEIDSYIDGLIDWL